MKNITMTVSIIFSAVFPLLVKKTFSLQCQPVLAQIELLLLYLESQSQFKVLWSALLLLYKKSKVKTWKQTSARMGDWTGDLGSTGMYNGQYSLDFSEWSLTSEPAVQNKLNIQSTRYMSTHESWSPLC